MLAANQHKFMSHEKRWSLTKFFKDQGRGLLRANNFLLDEGIDLLLNGARRQGSLLLKSIRSVPGEVRDPSEGLLA